MLSHLRAYREQGWTAADEAWIVTPTTSAPTPR